MTAFQVQNSSSPMSFINSPDIEPAISPAPVPADAQALRSSFVRLAAAHFQNLALLTFLPELLEDGDGKRPARSGRRLLPPDPERRVATERAAHTDVHALH